MLLTKALEELSHENMLLHESLSWALMWYEAELGNDVNHSSVDPVWLENYQQAKRLTGYK